MKTLWSPALALLAAFPVIVAAGDAASEKAPSGAVRSVYVEVVRDGPVKDDEKFQKVRENLVAAVLTKVRTRPTLQETADAPKADLKVTTVVSRLRYVSAAARVLTGVGSGRARLRADVTLVDQNTGKTLWTAAIDTMSAASAGIFGGSTTSQVEYLSTQIVAAVEGCVAGSCPPNVVKEIAEEDPAIDEWRRAVVGAVRAAWEKPSDGGVSVECELQITVDSTGKLTNVGWLVETPDRRLNKSIVKAFKASSPYPPPPPQFVKDGHFRTVIAFTDAD